MCQALSENIFQDKVHTDAGMTCWLQLAHHDSHHHVSDISAFTVDEFHKGKVFSSFSSKRKPFAILAQTGHCRLCRTCKCIDLNILHSAISLSSHALDDMEYPGHAEDMCRWYPSAASAYGWIFSGASSWQCDPASVACTCWDTISNATPFPNVPGVGVLDCAAGWSS